MREYKIQKIEMPNPPHTLVAENPHPTLRFARLDDIPDLLEMARSLTEDSAIQMIGHTNSKTRVSLEAAILADQKEWLVLVSHDQDKPVGVLAAYVLEPLFSENKIAYEVLMYLQPEYRKGRRGLDLLKAYEHWAKLVGCRAVHYGWLSSSPPELKKLYEHLGCVKSEEVYFKVLT